MEARKKGWTKEMINTYENQDIEFKQEYVSDINKEVIAFVNADGGTILIGVRFLISSINYTQSFTSTPHGCFFKMLAIY